MDSSAARRLLNDTFGHAAFRPGQEAVIAASREGRDILAVMPTGAGKSLTYQLPALLEPGLTVVISPLIALMKDQVEALHDKEIAAATLNSSMTQAEQAHVLDKLASLKLLYLSPERLQQPALRDRLQAHPVSRLVVDEAHCVSHWGHDFRPDYRTIAGVRRALGALPLTALTATATPAVQDDIISALELRDPVRFVTGFDRPNLAFHVWPVACEPAKAGLVKHFLERIHGPGIIYAGTRQETETLCERLRSWDYRASYYHAARSQAERSAAQDAFMAGRLDLIVATSAFGMGVDKADIRFVLHYRPPGTLEAYYQEAGRAGRDGQPAVCVMLYAPGDRKLPEWFIERSSPQVFDLKRLYLHLRHTPQGRWTGSLQELAVRLQTTPARTMGAVRELGRQEIVGHSPGPPLELDLREPYESQVPEFDASALEAFKRHRYRLLDDVHNYVDSTCCRRMSLLAYFGDTTQPDTACGCDRCHPPPRPPLSEDSIAILKLCRLPQRRDGLSKTLRGTGKPPAEPTAAWGRLSGWTEQHVTTQFDQLIDQGCLVERAGKLELSSRGKRYLAEPPQRLLKVARDHCLELAERGATPAQIAVVTQLPERRVERFLTELVQEGKLASERLVRPDVRTLIESAVATYGASHFRRLKDALPEDISDLEIRAVLASGDL